MNILLVNHYAGSNKYGMEYRPYYLSREWARKGHNVTIVSSTQSHLRNANPEIKKDLETEVIEDINYLWIKTPSYKGSGLMRIVNIITFVIKLFFYSKSIQKISEPDIIISSSTYTLDIFPCYLIAKKSSAKLCFELHDMWPLSPMIIGNYSKYHPFIWLVQRAENFACRKSDYYVSMLGNTKDYLMEHGLSPNKFHYIPNGYCDDANTHTKYDSLPDEHKSLIEQLKSDSKIIVGYAGGHNPSNALKSFIFAAEDFLGNGNIVFVLVGKGEQKDELILEAKRRNINNIYFLNEVNKNVIPTLLDNFDILFAGGVKSILHSYGTSYNKLVDYMMAGKPIIFAVDEPNSLVEKVGCGIQIPAENKLEIVNAIKKISSLTIQERIEMGNKGKKFATTELKYSSLADRFLQIFAGN